MIKNKKGEIMERRLFFCLLLLNISALHAPVFFQGLVEGPDIDKNSFLCPASAADGIQGCKDTELAAHGYDVSGGRTIQLCNNQEYWLQQEAAQAQYIATVRNYTGSDLTAQLLAEGWKAMGGYAIVISSNPLLTNLIMPEVVAAAGQTKVIIQLWYNGSDMIQLWSQDAMVFSSGQSFQVSISNTMDTQLLQNMTAAQATQTSWQDSFLLQLNLQPNNCKNSDYSNAVGCPRQIRLTLFSA